MKTLITGINGFIGTWLAQELMKRGDEVHGLTRQIREEVPAGLEGVQFHAGDIADRDAMSTLVQELQPDRIFHLAAQSNIPQSFEDPVGTMEANLIGTMGLFDAVRAHAPHTLIVSAGSSAEYGRSIVPGVRATEETPLTPTSPYGVSKAAQSLYTSMAADVYGLKVIHVRPFAILGPGKKGDSVSDFCKGALAVERGEAESLKVGNLTPTRDIVDIRDFVQGIILIAEKGEAGESYNICTGTETTIQQVVDAIVGAASTSVTVEVDQAKFRPVDDPWIVGDNSKLVALGFVPKYTLQQTLADTLEYWRGEK
jgi:GDP-4-dehydro-6-deoxy-D-mannose reductase